MHIAISISTCRPCSNSTICAAEAARTTGAHDATPVQDIVPGHPSCFIQYEMGAYGVLCSLLTHQCQQICI